jgi:hypothetical protein
VDVDENRTGREVGTEFFANDAGETEHISWVFGPQQTGLDQEGYFVVLNAWSIILCLPLNLEDFALGLQCFRDTRNLIQSVLRGHTNWLVIWAFLRCHRFVGLDQAPEVGRRFGRTIPMDESGTRRETMLARAAGPGTGPLINRYDHFREGEHLRHDQGFE